MTQAYQEYDPRVTLIMNLHVNDVLSEFCYVMQRLRQVAPVQAHNQLHLDVFDSLLITMPESFSARMVVVPYPFDISIRYAVLRTGFDTALHENVQLIHYFLTHESAFTQLIPRLWVNSTQFSTAAPAAI